MYFFAGGVGVAKWVGGTVEVGREMGVFLLYRVCGGEATELLVVPPRREVMQVKSGKAVKFLTSISVSIGTRREDVCEFIARPKVDFIKYLSAKLLKVVLYSFVYNIYY